MSNSLCTQAQGFNSSIQWDRSQYLSTDFLNSLQGSGLEPISPNGTTSQENFVFSLPSSTNSLVGLYQSNVAAQISSIDGSTGYLGYDNGFGNWIPGQTNFGINYGELCPCTDLQDSQGNNCMAIGQMGNFDGPMTNDGLSNYKVAFCSSTGGNYGCTGLFQNVTNGTIDFDYRVFGSLYNLSHTGKKGLSSDVQFWRVGQPIPLGKQALAPDGITPLDQMQLYFNMPSSGGVQPCGSEYPSNQTQSNPNEWWSLGDIGKIFEFDPELGACSQRVVCPGGICEGDFPRKTPDGPINYWGNTHDDYSNIYIQDTKDYNTGNTDGYGNDLFCEVFGYYDGQSLTYSNDPIVVNRMVTQTETSFSPTMFGNINLFDPGSQSSTGVTFNSIPGAFRMCNIPAADFPYGTYYHVHANITPGFQNYTAYNCQIANPQLIPFSSESNSGTGTYDGFNKVPAGYFYWDEQDAVSSSYVGDWGAMTYNGNPIPGSGFTVLADLLGMAGSSESSLVYSGNKGGKRTYNLSGAGYNKATQRSSGGSGYAVRTFCPSLYGPLGAGQQYCGFGGKQNVVNQNNPYSFQQYSNIYNGLDPNCALNADLYSLANEYNFSNNNWSPEDWKLYYMYLDEYGMDGNGLCPLLGDTCKNTSSPTPTGQLFVEPNCVNCLAGNFAYGVMYDNPDAAADAGTLMNNGTPMNMRGNMQSTSFPGTSPGNNSQTSSTAPTAASSLMGCDRMIGYQTVGYNGKTVGVHATCACTDASDCYCWNTAGDWNGNDLPEIYSDQTGGGTMPGGEGNCWIQNGYENNINRE